MGIDLAEQGWLPDRLIRAGIRRLVAERLEQQRRSGQTVDSLVERLRQGPIAVETRKANEQHYEVPPEFFAFVLGRRLKYSGCYWPTSVRSLDEAEEAMLRLTCERAGIEDGMEILDLGCGWGSLSLWIAEKYPRCRLLAVSNSGLQGRHIASECARRGIRQVEVATADVNGFGTERRFDRVVSIEMFEHMRNYEALLARIARWLRPEGSLFVHIFCHRDHAYLYEPGSASDWMARWFFTGGTMPSSGLLARFQNDLQLTESWNIEGSHYARTSEAWLRNLDARKQSVIELFERTYGPASAERWFHRWRLFFMACAELFAFGGGKEWGVGHYLFRQRSCPRGAALRPR